MPRLIAGSSFQIPSIAAAAQAASFGAILRAQFQSMFCFVTVSASAWSFQNKTWHHPRDRSTCQQTPVTSQHTHPLESPDQAHGHANAIQNSSFPKPHHPSLSSAVTQMHLQYLKIIFSRSKGYSMIPVVGTLTRSTSCWVGRYPGVAIRSTSLR